MKKITILAILLLTCCIGNITAQTPASWTFKLVDKGNSEVELLANVSIGNGWHLYSTEVLQDGPYATALSIDEVKGATAIGQFKAVSGKLIKEYSKDFSMEIGYYEHSASFAQTFKITDRSKFSLKGDVRAQTCNDQTCTPPTPVEYNFGAKDLPASVVAAASKTDTEAAVKKPQVAIRPDPPVIVRDSSIVVQQAAASPTVTAKQNLEENPLWTPVVGSIEEFWKRHN